MEIFGETLTLVDFKSRGVPDTNEEVLAMTWRAGGSESLRKISRMKLTIDKMENKLLENCIMSEEL